MTVSKNKVENGWRNIIISPEAYKLLVLEKLACREDLSDIASNAIIKALSE